MAMDWIQRQSMDKIDFILWNNVRLDQKSQPTFFKHGNNRVQQGASYETRNVPAFIPVLRGADNDSGNAMFARDDGETCYRINANSRLRILAVEASFCSQTALTWLDQELRQAQVDNVQVFILNDPMDSCSDGRLQIVAEYAGIVLSELHRQPEAAYPDNRSFLRVYRYIADPQPTLPISHLVSYKEYLPRLVAGSIQYESSDRTFLGQDKF